MVKTIDAETAIVKAYSKKMINSSQKSSLNSARGDYKKVDELLDYICKWINGDEKNRYDQFLKFLREMDLSSIAQEMKGTMSTGHFMFSARLLNCTMSLYNYLVR